MNLAIDSGNTFSKIGWFSGDKLVRWEAGLRFEELIDAIRLEIPERIIYASVNLPVSEFVAALNMDVPLIDLNGNTPTPLIKDYKTPHTLGADRIAAATGAHALFPGSDVAVIDLGTCITYDLIGKEGVFHGGMISPGMQMRFKALHAFTNRLPLLEPTGDPVLVGKSTQEAIQSGVINGIVCEIEGIIDRYRHERPGLRVVVCGGDASFFESRLKDRIFVVPELVLVGLNRILIYNVALQ